MREVEELRPLTAGRLLRIRREAERGGWDEAERGLRCNAQVLAESCFTGGEAVFADGEAVLEELSVAEMETLLSRLCGEGHDPREKRPAAVNPNFDAGRFETLRGERA